MQPMLREMEQSLYTDIEIIVTDKVGELQRTIRNTEHTLSSKTSLTYHSTSSFVSDLVAPEGEMRALVCVLCKWSHRWQTDSFGRGKQCFGSGP
jgi:hypothetical protein